MVRGGEAGDRAGEPVGGAVGEAEPQRQGQGPDGGVGPAGDGDQPPVAVAADLDLTEEIRAAGARRRETRAEGTLVSALAAISPAERDALISVLGRLHQLLVGNQPPRRFPASPAAAPR